MLQIIGWLGCLYLFVKGWEIAGNDLYQVKTSQQLAAEKNFERGGRDKPPNPPLTRLSAPAFIAMLTAWCGAAVFAALIHLQADRVPPAAAAKQPPQTFSECLREAESVDEIKKCRDR